MGYWTLLRQLAFHLERRLNYCRAKVPRAPRYYFSVRVVGCGRFLASYLDSAPQVNINVHSLGCSEACASELTVTLAGEYQHMGTA